MLVSVVFILVSLLVFGKGVKSDTTITFSITSGADTTSGAQHEFTPAELAKLSTSDNSRIQSDANWSMTGVYEEDKYLEFLFQPGVPTEVIISSVVVTHEYYRTSALVGAKLEIWDGELWNDVPISLPHSSGTANEISETKDITSIISQPSQLNNIKIRFLAYRNDVIGSGIKTSHDLIKLDVIYSEPTNIETPTPEVIATETPTPTPEETSLPPLSPSPSSEPTQIATPTPMVFTATPTVTSSPLLTISPTPEIVLNSPININVSPSPTPNNLTANIVSIPKEIKKIKPIPTASTSPIQFSKRLTLKSDLANLLHWLTHHLIMLKR